MTSEFAKEKIFWTKKMNLKLVKFIENRPYMWNKRHPNYNSAHLKDQTFAEFAAEYGNAFSGQAVKDRWTNIRTTFAQHSRKLKTSMDPDMEYQVKWHLWDACQFLNRIKKSHSSLREATLSNDYEVKRENLVKMEIDGIESNNELSSNEDEVNTSRPHNGGEETMFDCNTFAEQLFRVFKGVQADVFGINQAFHAKVGRMVEKKLRSMTSYDAGRLTQKIINILLLYDENNPGNPNNVKHD